MNVLKSGSDKKAFFELLSEKARSYSGLPVETLETGVV